VKYLPQFGWQPVVLTVKEVAYYATDPSLLDEVKDAKIYRSGSLDPQRILAFLSPKSSKEQANRGKTTNTWLAALNRLANFFFVPDPKLFWLPFAIFKALRIIKKESIDCLLITSPPHSSHFAGMILKMLTGRPLVVDFRDGWSGGNFQSEPTLLHRWLNRVLEKWVIRRADCVIGVSTRLVEKLKKHSADQPFKFSCITNGFDAEDFSSAKPSGNPIFTITYCGALTRIAPLGSFFLGLRQLLNSRPELRGKISVHLVGSDVRRRGAAEARELGLEDTVTFTGYVTHRTAIAELLQADLLLYPVADWASTDFVPGKTFEYLASGKPVLVIGPSVEGVEILKTTARVEALAHEDVDGIARAILKYFESFQAGQLKAKPAAEIFKYERKHLTQELSKIFNSVTMRKA
jgi:glycosyltransferase involved in cell wall biosynthesis